MQGEFVLVNHLLLNTRESFFLNAGKKTALYFSNSTWFQVGFDKLYSFVTLCRLFRTTNSNMVHVDRSGTILLNLENDRDWAILRDGPFWFAQRSWQTQSLHDNDLTLFTGKRIRHARASLANGGV